MTLRKHKGARNELLATCKLWDMGYEVFRNLSQHGPVDLIAIDFNTGIIRKFDVKAATCFVNKNGEVRLSGAKLKPSHIELGIEFIYVSDDENVYMQL